MSMTSALHVILDCSGSMATMGKKAALRAVVGYMLTLKRWADAPGHYNFLWRLWADSVRSVEISPQLTEYIPEGQASLDALAVYLDDAVCESDFLRVLIVTDGVWPNDAAKQLTHWRKTHTHVSIRFVRMGQDACHSLFAEPGCYAPSDVGLALYPWPEGSRKPATISSRAAP